VKEIIATVASVHTGSGDDLSKEEQASIQVELDGIVGDRHRGYERSALKGDKQPQGTVRRNERQWSAVSSEELFEIQSEMGLREPLTATSLGANIYLSGLHQLSRLPKGTTLKFPSGAELIVEEYNPPCHDMGKKLAALHSTGSGEALSSTAFSKSAVHRRGVVGSVEVAGLISAGDEVIIKPYKTPPWLIRTED
jgi:MOSC domain-containing protein YiiM